MPRPRKSLAQARVSGAYAKNPGRYKRRNEPRVGEPIGDPPDWMTPAQKVAWRQYAAALPWLNYSHRCMLEITSYLAARMAAGELGVSGMNLLRQCLGQLGATPADASKVQQFDDEDDPISQEYFT